MEYYFAYSIYMDIEQMRLVCPDSKTVGAGKLYGYRLDFTRYSTLRESTVADIIESGNDEVFGIIYELSEKDLERLNDFEVARKFYNKIYVDIHHYRPQRKRTMGNKGLIRCFTYEVTNKNPKAGKASIEYINPMIEAAFKYRFPFSYIKKINEFCKKDLLAKKSDALDFFIHLMDYIKTEEFINEAKAAKEWGGARLVITGNLARKRQLASSHPNDLVIFTPHWRELSWLIKKIYSNRSINWRIDGYNKYYFLNEMGKAANEYQKKKGRNRSGYRGICEATLVKAYSLFT